MILSAIFVRQSGHSEQASEQGLHTADIMSKSITFSPKCYVDHGLISRIWNHSQQK